MNNIYEGIVGGLGTFEELDINRLKLREYIRQDHIKTVLLFVLGPEGTNICMASKKWVDENNIGYKAEYVLCNTPEEAVDKANAIKDEETLPIFVLCAVYNKLHELYFSNQDCLFFMDHLYMKLDKMQLATNSIKKKERYKVISHPSPSSLLMNINEVDIIYSPSNSYSAIACKNNNAELCITTESSRKDNQLIKIHEFGSPWMLFTFGTTSWGVNLLNKYKTS